MKKPNGFEENPKKPKKPDNDNEDEEDNDNEDDINNIYLILFNKYKERVRTINFWGEKITTVNKIKEEPDYLKLSSEEQENLINELLTS